MYYFSITSLLGSKDLHLSSGGRKVSKTWKDEKRLPPVGDTLVAMRGRLPPAGSAHRHFDFLEQQHAISSFWLPVS
jgi:hypothetical protein